MTEMPEIASDGVKMNFGHKEFVPRKKMKCVGHLEVVSGVDRCEKPQFSI